MDTAIKILIAVVLGALLLAGLYALFNDTVLPTLVRRVQEMFDYLAQLHATDGITVTELITRQKTVNELIALNFTYEQLAKNGKNIIV